MLSLYLLKFYHTYSYTNFLILNSLFVPINIPWKLSWIFLKNHLFFFLSFLFWLCFLLPQLFLFSLLSVFFSFIWVTCKLKFLAFSLFSCKYFPIIHFPTKSYFSYIPNKNIAFLLEIQFKNFLYAYDFLLGVWVIYKYIFKFRNVLWVLLGYMAEGN